MNTAAGTTPVAPAPVAERPAPVSFADAFAFWLKLGFISFGGPAGQIAIMHAELVERRRWISEKRFLHALNYCMLLPGPEAQQLATYIGWLLHGWRGGIVAGTLFILPGFVSILALSLIYGLYQDTTLVQALFYGLKAAVLAVVVAAVFRIGARALRNRIMVAITGVAFVALFFAELPFPAVVLGAGVLGLIGGRLRPDLFVVMQGHRPSQGQDAPVALADHVAHHTPPTGRHTLLVLAIWLPLWLGPIVIMGLALGWQHVLTTQAVFFSKAAMVTFGGAYSVLAYVAQQAVETYQWLAPQEMLDGLGMAETTPGPLIQVVQFVGFLGAYRNPAPFGPITAAVLGSIVTTWVTFTPCFLWIFLGAPYIEHLRGNRLLSAALSTITAAVVGAILNLAVWFALHVIFGQVDEVNRLGLRLLMPRWSSVDIGSLCISAAAFFAMFRLKWGMIPTLSICAAVGLVWFMLRTQA